MSRMGRRSSHLIALLALLIAWLASGPQPTGADGLVVGDTQDHRPLQHITSSEKGADSEASEMAEGSREEPAEVEPEARVEEEGEAPLSGSAEVHAGTPRSLAPDQSVPSAPEPVEEEAGAAAAEPPQTVQTDQDPPEEHPTTEGAGPLPADQVAPGTPAEPEATTDGDGAEGAALEGSPSTPSEAMVEPEPLPTPRPQTSPAAPQAQPAAPPQPAQPFGAGKSTGQRSHVVVQGETLWGIGVQHSVAWPSLASLNRLANPDLIFPEQVVMLPGKSGVPTQLPAPGLVAPGQARDQQGRPNSPRIDSTRRGAGPSSPSRASAPPSDRSVSPTSPIVLPPFSVPDAGFLLSAVRAARAAMAATRVPASVTVAQAILESDWGRATLGANNYFGIKAETRAGPAGVVWAITSERTADGWITIRAPFRAYENMEQSFQDHGWFFHENSRYAEALRHVDDPRRFAALIHQAGYATDPLYAQSLLRIMDQLDLYRHDRP